MGKLSRLVTVAAVAAATGAGVFYYLNKSQLESAKNVDEDGDGISGTGTTAQDSVADFFREKREQIMNSREYVTLSENVSVAKDALVKTVTEAAEMIKEKAAEAKDGVGVVADDGKDKAEDFAFEEFTDEPADAEETVADAVTEENAEETAEETVVETEGAAE